MKSVYLKTSMKPIYLMTSVKLVYLETCTKSVYLEINNETVLPQNWYESGLLVTGSKPVCLETDW